MLRGVHLWRFHCTCTTVSLHVNPGLELDSSPVFFSIVGIYYKSLFIIFSFLFFSNSGKELTGRSLSKSMLFSLFSSKER